MAGFQNTKKWMTVQVVTMIAVTAIQSSQLALASLLTSHFKIPAKKIVFHAAGTKWDFFEGDQIENKDGTKDLELQFIARSPVIMRNSFQPTLTMRIDPSEVKTSRLYAEKWLKEFPKFGYELQMSREATYGALEGYEMELKSNFSDRRVRQFVVKRPHEIWIFTCSSDQDHFTSIFRDCEKILKTAENNF